MTGLAFSNSGDRDVLAFGTGDGSKPTLIFEGDERLFTGRDTGADFLGDQNGHPIFRFLVTELREQGIVFATAEHDELFPSLGLQELWLHESSTLPVDLPPMSDGADFQNFAMFHQNDSVVTVTHAEARGTNHPFDVPRTVNAELEERCKDTLLHRRRQFAERLGGGRGKDERLAHIASIVSSTAARKRQSRSERSPS